MKKKHIIILVAALAILTCVIALKRAHSRRGSADADAAASIPKKQPPLVTVETVETQTLSRTLTLTGSVEPVRVASLASPAEGPIQVVKVREGDRVRAGDVLATIGRKAAKNAWLASAREELRKEEEELKRIEQLVAQGALAGDQLDLAKTNHERARARLAEAEESARDYQILAPWDGIVSRVLVMEGNYVAPRTALVELFDPESLVVRVAVPEASAASVREGMSARVTFDAYPTDSFQALVSRVYPELDPRMRTRMIELQPTENVSLLPGMFARIEIVMGSVEHAVAVPRDAIVVTAEGEQIVYVVAEGKVVRRKVQTGIEEGRRVQILSGISAGEKVVVAGVEKLKNGMAVRVEEEGKNAQSPSMQGPSAVSGVKRGEGTQ